MKFHDENPSLKPTATKAPTRSIRKMTSRLVIALLLHVCAMNLSSLFSDQSNHPRRLESSQTGGIFRRTRPSTLVCRLIVVETLVEISETEMHSEERTECIPIVDDHERNDDSSYHIELPWPFFELHKDQIERGELYVTITKAMVDGESVQTTDSSTFAVVDPLKEKDRRLEKNGVKAGTMGTRSVAVVRISTTDSSVNASAREIDNALFGDGINFVSQYRACSFGQLNWVRSRYGGVINMRLNRGITSFSGAAEVIKMAEKKIRARYRIRSASDLADNVLFCVPPGTGKWAASAGVNFWRSQFNSEWCTSLTANMHEIGHNLGLGHASENGEAYGDRTGYMAGGYKNSTWPLKCFSGYNNWLLGWYRSREVRAGNLHEFSAVAFLLLFCAAVPHTYSEFTEPLSSK